MWQANAKSDCINYVLFLYDSALMNENTGTRFASSSISNLSWDAIAKVGLGLRELAPVVSTVLNNGLRGF